MTNIHANCVVLEQKGILIIGKSGYGKSDVALRLIEEAGAKLVADDRVDLEARGSDLMASVPATIAGLMEVRGIGVAKFDYLPSCKIDFVIELVDSYNQVERMPEPDFIELEGISIKKAKLYAFEASILSKIKLLVRM